MNTQAKILYRSGLAGLGAMLLLGVAGCKAKQDANQAVIAQQDATGADPADANLAPGTSTSTGSSQPTQVMGQSSSYAPQQQAESYQGQAAAPPGQTYQDQSYPPSGDDQYNDYDADPAEYSTQAPPPLPEYDQPPAPGPDWYWTPGYWAWGTDGYYWVPGTWVEPPYYGALWTPPYWGWYGGHYRFHHGYWGEHVGFYGGIDYGFGYIGFGYFGGYWHGHDFYYNRSVTNVGNVGYYYNRPVVVNNVTYGARPVNRVSYNGGRGGLNVAPRPQEVAAMHERHTAPIAAQTQMRQYAAQNRAQSFAQNQGKPDHAAFARPEATGFTPNRAAEANRPAQPNAAEPNRAGAPGFTNRPAEPNRSAPVNNATEANRPGAPIGGQMHNDHQQPNRAEGAPVNNRVEPNRSVTRARPQAQPARPQPEQRNFQQARPQEARPQVQQQRPQQAPRQEMARPAPAPRAEAPRPAPAPHAEAPRPAPAPHVEAPRPAPAPHESGGGEHPHQR